MSSDILEIQPQTPATPQHAASTTAARQSGACAGRYGGLRCAALRPAGAAEFSGWFAGSPVLAQTASAALAGHAVDRTFVLPGSDAPVPGRVPPQCSFGGRCWLRPTQSARPRRHIAGPYLELRRAREAGAPTWWHDLTRMGT